MSEARDSALRLTPWVGADTVVRSMLFWYGAAAGYRLLGETAVAEIAIAGARALADDYDQELGLIPLGVALGEQHDPTRPRTTIDAVGPLAALLGWGAWRTDDTRLQEVAEHHVTAHAKLCLCPDGSVRTSVPLYGASSASEQLVWARGQAWGILAFTLAARWISKRFLDEAQQAADWWGRAVPHDAVAPAYIPRSTTSEPVGVAPAVDMVDTSASAIAACALLDLADQMPQQGARYRAVAERMLRMLTGHVAPRDAVDGPARGGLLDGCYDPRQGIAVRNELIWGNFFLSYGLGILDGRWSLGML